MTTEVDLIKEAVAGDRDSQFALARKYRDGDGVAVDTKKAIKWFNSASENGHIRAKYELALLLFKNGNKNEKTKAIALMEEAAKKGERDAMMYLARAYRDGTSVGKDAKKSIAMYKKAMSNGSIQAKLELAEALYKSEDPADRSMSVIYCYELVTGESEDKNAMFRLYLQYRYGVGTKVDSEIAYMWLKRASEQGHGGAAKEIKDYHVSATAKDPNGEMMFRLARKMKEEGSVNDAIGLYRKAVDMGFSRAKPELAELLYRSDDLMDRLESVRLGYESAVMGDKDGMFRLYLQYQYGVGVKKDLPVSEMWLKKAADAGHGTASKLVRNG